MIEPHIARTALVLRLTVAGDRNEKQVEVEDRSQPPAQIEAVDARHAEVDQGHVRLVAASAIARAVSPSAATRVS